MRWGFYSSSFCSKSTEIEPNRPNQFQENEKTNSGYKQCKIKETLLIRDLELALNKNIDSEKLLLY